MPILPPTPPGATGLTSAAFPLVLPIPSFSSIKIGLQGAASVSQSPFTGSRQVFEWPGEYLTAQVALPPMNALKARAWCATLALLRGRSGTFLLGDTSQKQPQGSVSGSPLVNGAGQTGKTLNTKGWTASATLVLRSGDWIQIGSGLTQRLYMNLLDVNADGSGNATLNIFPRLRESPANSAALVTAGPTGLFALASNAVEYDVDEALIYGISFAAVEAI